MKVVPENMSLVTITLHGEEEEEEEEEEGQHQV